MMDVCVPVTPPAPDAGAEPDTGAADDDAGTEDAAPESFLGKPCTDAVNHSECGGDADYCAIQPTQTEGICTITGCMLPDIGCPSGWRCLDLSVFDPMYPAICIEST